MCDLGTKIYKELCFTSGRGNPEVIAPLNKLRGMIGGGSQHVVVTGRLSGNDIFLANERTGMKRFRSS